MFASGLGFDRWYWDNILILHNYLMSGLIFADMDGLNEGRALQVSSKISSCSPALWMDVFECQSGKLNLSGIKRRDSEDRLETNRTNSLKFGLTDIVLRKRFRIMMDFAVTDSIKQEKRWIQR